MSFQENRFPIILGATTAVLVGGLAYWGISSSGKYATAKEDYDSAVSEISRLTRGPAYPDSANVSAKGKAVADYKTAVEEMQKSFDKYRETKISNVGVDVFGDALRKARAELVEKFEKSGTEMPGDAHLGLGIYTRETVNAKNTGLLLYQLKAFETLFGYFADARIKEVHNIHRPLLPEEQGKKVDLKGKSYRQHPIEITFSGRESSLRSFLSSLDDSDEFAYVVRTIRIKNERATAPSAKDARFEVPKEAAEEASPFGAGGFEFPDEEGDADDAPAEGEAVVAEEVDAGPSDSGQILKQVLGDELIEVFVRIDVIQFLDPKPLP
ncbi:Amuc_1100 family pilus-like protein [Haloferula chungangensis]|uniref:Amuc_1100 family pilus-like protein n=1 Tax=Haloferula chungangensis TaxID=1048331 RepID=A0ABW2L457_9BACT